MTKTVLKQKELIKNIAQIEKIKFEKAKKLYKTFEIALLEGILNYDEVVVSRSIGKFAFKKSKERTIINPQKRNETIHIPEHERITFQFFPKLKKEVKIINLFKKNIKK
ncbi:MAG: HU family DNA-binding protein [Candidatus Phytoplasma stylosanthis]|uniref:HU family DNA-binding protein n=1 Tax=Candidatus Phytoplasma stylosanthis TaxID=2798314 RepID=UPI00293B125F|nr:HU family DNA-binding protein [Candidatus Phytoplasma stylosanthis]MDV3168144.1 HU family DNA-binding protein [Candidatus Phytoplasma stylosanthis]MDV3170833.1 HU family DNA-binding protein [Candidatus Phytoplasma stylosanthis]MDV3173865.1 HU family DNA-binding protein [Candidatus Phytoplasma stylosanthis]MDV3174153.1 HU family DNA-binding protein [Candidatus Phytoplasma stylosanthis]MDV3202555.1 HU family DNA-binding protein [Candidatus Phytoplasma stylosanthis]